MLDLANKPVASIIKLMNHCSNLVANRANIPHQMSDSEEE